VPRAFIISKPEVNRCCAFTSLPIAHLFPSMQTPQLAKASLQTLVVGRSILQKEPNRMLQLKEEDLMQRRPSSRKYKALSSRSQGKNSINKQGKYFSLRVIIQKSEILNRFIICACNMKHISAQRMFFQEIFCRFCCCNIHRYPGTAQKSSYMHSILIIKNKNKCQL